MNEDRSGGLDIDTDIWMSVLPVVSFPDVCSIAMLDNLLFMQPLTKDSEKHLPQNPSANHPQSLTPVIHAKPGSHANEMVGKAHFHCRKAMEYTIAKQTIFVGVWTTMTESWKMVVQIKFPELPTSPLQSAIGATLLPHQ